MSRGGWIVLIGGIMFLIGIGLFAFGSASFLADLSTASSTLSPGAFQNLTVEVSEVGTLLTYSVSLPDFSPGDEVTVLLRLPSGQETQRTTLESSGPLAATYVATGTGTYTVVIQNTATQSVEISHTATSIGLAAQGLLSAGFLVGIVGFIALIIGLILWLVDRRRARKQQPTGLPPPPTSPP